MTTPCPTCATLTQRLAAAEAKNQTLISDLTPAAQAVLDAAVKYAMEEEAGTQGGHGLAIARAGNVLLDAIRRYRETRPA